MPLVSLIWTVLGKGLPVINAEFLTYSMRNIIGDEQGGIYHAIIGTLLITAAAAVISVPIGLMTAIYLVEYGDNSRHRPRSITLPGRRDDRHPVDRRRPVRLRAVRAVLRRGRPDGLRRLGRPVAADDPDRGPLLPRRCSSWCPHDLREAAYALGVPKWRTIVKVVLPTALAGIITGVTLAIARVIGETAPLLIIAGSTDSVNINLFDDADDDPAGVHLLLATRSRASRRVRPGTRAWGAALVLIIIVMALNLLARLLGSIFAPKKGR